MKALMRVICIVVVAASLQVFAQTEPPRVAAHNSEASSAKTTSGVLPVSPEQWQQAVAFHGHTCAGLAMGVRVARAAIRELGENEKNNEVVAIVETNRCPVDAIQMLTHCTAGKRSLIIEANDRNVFTFIRRADGKAVRITVKEAGWGKPDPAFEPLRAKVIANKATAEEEKKFDELMQVRAAAILSAAEDHVLKIEEVKAEIPEKYRR
jgi:formylmethanofuran dehydrogenase subunit E